MPPLYAMDQHSTGNPQSSPYFRSPPGASTAYQTGYLWSSSATKKELPDKGASTRPTTSSDTPVSSCPICFDPMSLSNMATTKPPSKSLENENSCPSSSEKSVAIISCGHVFGDRCLSTWMETSNTCPLCRLEFCKKEEQYIPEPDFFPSWRRHPLMMTGLPSYIAQDSEPLSDNHEITLGDVDPNIDIEDDSAEKINANSDAGRAAHSRGESEYVEGSRRRRRRGGIIGHFFA
ncbi:hypothetical protein DM02DRAFT_655528 [Periconia macrospinosa]|uniref:RING-type domain-containing protein n=1 Tax=Periconia macrospinosa TaxID=97972 RepID=A0A2V1DQL8_9PLEO|nr:hypothetical protein DM02DRAFT_655528 [Periconia macrospinosa]